VRRGGERFLHTLSHYLATRYHEVTVFTSKPGPADTTWEGGVRFVRASEINHGLLTLAGITPTSTFIVPCFRFLRKNQFDVVHCLHYADGFAAALAQRTTGTPYIVHVTGIPVGRWLRRCPWETYFMRMSVRHAARVATISRAGAEALRVEYCRNPDDLLVPPSDLEGFKLRVGRDLKTPIILGVADFTQRRKGASILVRAFERVKDKIPSAILQYSGNVPADLRTRLLAMVSRKVAADVQFLGLGKSEDLPAIYGRAALTVLPSVQESFGLVLVESLACGTPVVGSDDAGIPDIIEEGVGTLFSPGSSRHNPSNVEGLTTAILEALELYRNPDVHVLCRQSAERFGWERLGPLFEQMYYRAVEGHSPSNSSPN